MGVYDEDNDISPDDALEEARDGLLGSTIDPLEEDYDTPAAPAQDDSLLPDDHPQTDTGLDPSEVYEKGEDGAAKSL